MPIPIKNKAQTDIENTVATEEVVLSAKESNTPASLVVDEGGFVDVENFIETEPEHGGEQNVNNENKDKDDGPAKGISFGLISRFLAFMRRPENWLLQRYYESKVRNKLLSRFDWYRDFECEAELTNKMGNLYGTNSPLSHFFRNNILVSLIIIAVSAQLAVDYVSRPVENRYAAKEPPPVAAVAQTERQPDYSHILNHCAVTDGLRGLYDQTDSPQVKHEVIAAVQGFIKVYDRSEIEQWHADQDSKRGAVVSQIQSILPRIQRYREQIVAGIEAENMQRAQLKSKLDSISRTGAHINKSIKLRNQITEIETQMETGPNQKFLLELDAQLERLDRLISGQETVDRPVSNWVRNISEQDQTTLVDSVRDIIDKDIDTNIAQVADGSAEVKQYRLRILIATLSHFGDLIRRLQSSSNYFEVNVSNRQRLTNGQLHTLFGSVQHSTGQLLSYDNCLTALNTTQTKLTVQ